MGEALALAAAVCFGTTHFLSGLLARRVDATAVALVAQLGGTFLILLVAPWFAAPHVAPADLGWGVLSGLGTGVGVVFLYRALSEGDFSVVVPLSDVAAVALPVLVGVLLLSERPGMAAWFGIAAALPALWLIARPAVDTREVGSTARSRSAAHSRSGSAARSGSAVRSGSRLGTRSGSRWKAGSGAPVGAWAVWLGRRVTRAGGSAGTRDALIAGIAFALQFIALARVGEDAGLWPLVASRAASVVAILPMASTMWRAPGEPERQHALAAQTGASLVVHEQAAPARVQAKAGEDDRVSVIGRVRMGPAMAAGAVGTGMLGTLAMALYLLATREQLMLLAVVLTALYPVIPVVLGLSVLRERVGRAQLAGLGFAAAAIALISLG